MTTQKDLKRASRSLIALVARRRSKKRGTIYFDFEKTQARGKKSKRGKRGRREGTAALCGRLGRGKREVGGFAHYAA